MYFDVVALGAKYVRTLPLKEETDNFKIRTWKSILFEFINPTDSRLQRKSTKITMIV